MSTNVRNVYHSNPEHSQYFVISWNLGNLCNYKCSYCPDVLHNGTAKFPSTILIISTLKHIKRQLPRDKKIYVEFTGGEVTLFPDFENLLSLIKTLNIKVGFISNGSKSKNFWNKIGTIADHVCLSFHKEFSKKDHFLDVIKTLNEKTSLHINIMGQKSHIKEAFNLASEIQKKFPNNSISLQPLILHDFESTRELINYSESELTMINKFNSQSFPISKNCFSTRGSMVLEKINSEDEVLDAPQIVANDLNKFKNFNCYAGLESIVIDFRGYVYRAKCKVGNEIAHITKRPFELPTAPVICNKDRCSCNFDITIKKEFIRTS